MRKLRAYYNDVSPYVCDWLRNLVVKGVLSPGVVTCKSVTEVTPDELRGFDRVHLFAGIGGWEYALNLAGWGEHPVWTGSCPCQPFSVAGRLRGSEDERDLWRHYHWLISECGPSVVLGEQVASPLGREWLSRVRVDLESLGYGVGASDLPAACVAAPHIRQREWWVGRRVGDAEREGLEGHSRHVGGGAESGRLEASSAGPAPAAGPAAPTIWLGDPHGNGRHREAVPAGPWRQGQATADHGGDTLGDLHGVAAGRAWATGAYITCRDGKARLIEPSILPLVDGLPTGMGSLRTDEDSPFRVIRDPKTGRSLGQAPWRQGMLQAYGNAIVPQVAAVFVRAFMQTQGWAPQLAG